MLPEINYNQQTLRLHDWAQELMKRAPLASGHPIPLQEDDRPAIAGGTPVRTRDARLVFGAPVIGEAEISSVVECLRSRWIGLGPRVEQLEQEFARYKGAPYAAAVSSGTAAIHLALVALGIGAGDEVIAPAMTFCSTIHSIVHTGARPVLVDCKRSTCNIDPGLIEKAITPRTRALLVVHMCGRCCEMDAIMEIARRHELRVVEDCAHAIESSYHSQSAGLMGDAGCFSFYPTKNVATCDGGMVITRDPELQERIKVLSLHGMTADHIRQLTNCADCKLIEILHRFSNHRRGSCLCSSERHSVKDLPLDMTGNAKYDVALLACENGTLRFEIAFARSVAENLFQHSECGRDEWIY